MRYASIKGVKRRLFLEGKPVHFIKGMQNSERNWMPSESQENIQIQPGFEKNGVVIEYLVSGEFPFDIITLR